MEKLGKQRRADAAAFRSFLEGRRVVFVGPAPTLVGQGTGAFINEFDVVVRTGGSPPIPPDRVADYGNRTDVWYVNSIFLNDLDQARIPVCLEQGLRWVCVKGMLAGERYLDAAPVSMRIYSSKVPGVRRPTIGACLVKEIADAHPQELHITGVTFFSSGFSDAHLSDYLIGGAQRHMDSVRGSSRDELEVMGHDYHNSDLFIKGLLDAGLVTMSAETEGHLNTALRRNARYE